MQKIKKDNTANILVALEVNTNDAELEKLNGFINKKMNIAEEIKHYLPATEHSIILSTKSFPRLKYNFPNQKLYLTSSVIVQNTTDALNEIVQNLLLDTLKRDVEFLSSGVVLEKPIQLIINSEEEPIKQISKVVMPKDFILLSDILKEEKDGIMYEKFLDNEFVYIKLKWFCGIKHLKIPAEAKRSIELPIHQKENNSGLTMIHKGIIPYFNQFKAAMNLIKGFESGTFENEIGKLMLMRSEYSQFAYERILSATQSGKDLDINKLSKKAISVIKKDPIKEIEITLLEKYL